MSTNNYITNNSAGGGLTAAQVQALIDASLINNVEEQVSTALNVVSGGTVTFVTTLTNITDVSVYNGTNDITEGVEIDITGSNVTVSSNQTLTGIIIKVNGNT